MVTRIGLRCRQGDTSWQPLLVVEEGEVWRQLGDPDAPSPLTDVLEADDPVALVANLSRGEEINGSWMAPLDQQEVWAAGVTYERSKAARIEESEAAADCYDRVYEAERPELFFKSLPYRCSGHGEEIRVRRDSKWNVPEPELTLCFDISLQLKAYTIGNDVSSRDIEGENPLYLPQAKVYDGSCALGPCLTLAEPSLDATKLAVALRVWRGEELAFSGETNVARMVRSFEELGSWLGRETIFPNGVYLMTGTGIVPAEDFTLSSGDRVEIEIEELGTLINPVA